MRGFYIFQFLPTRHPACLSSAFKRHTYPRTEIALWLTAFYWRLGWFLITASKKINLRPTRPAMAIPRYEVNSILITKFCYDCLVVVLTKLLWSQSIDIKFIHNAYKTFSFNFLLDLTKRNINSLKTKLLLSIQPIRLLCSALSFIWNPANCEKCEGDIWSVYRLW